MSQERNACYSCNGPLIDGCTRLAGLERRKLINWWKQKMGYGLNSELRKKAWLCIFCVRKARMQYDAESVQDEETVWWLAIKDPYFKYYTRGWLKSCSIQVENFIDANENQHITVIPIIKVEQEEAPDPHIVSGAVEQRFCELSTIDMKIEGDEDDASSAPIFIKVEPVDPDEIFNNPTCSFEENNQSVIEAFQHTEISIPAQLFFETSGSAMSKDPSIQSTYAKHSVPTQIVSTSQLKPPSASYSKMNRNALKSSWLKRNATAAAQKPLDTSLHQVTPEPYRKPMPKSKRLAAQLSEARFLNKVKEPKVCKSGYKCTSCPSNFPTYELLGDHYTDKHRNKQECEFCCMEFSNLAEVTEHQSRDHIYYGNAWLNSDSCDAASCKLVAFFKCSYCPFVSKTRCSLESHFTKTHKRYVAFKKIYCELCKTNFASFLEKSNHICKEFVAKKSKWFCASYRKHSTSQTCKMCKSEFPCAGFLTKHNQETKFACKKCSEKFCLVIDAQNHMMDVHKIKCSALQVTKGPKVLLPKKEKLASYKISKFEHYCVYCTNFYTCKGYRRSKYVCNDLYDVPYTCDECCVFFDTRFLLWKHYLSSPHKIAPKSSIYSQAEQDEIRENFKKQTWVNFQCPDCGLEINKIRHDFHMQVDHGKTAFVCKEKLCGKMFYSLPDMQNHEREHKEQSVDSKEGVASVISQLEPVVDDANVPMEQTEDLRRPMPQFLQETAKDYGHKLFCALQFENESSGGEDEA